MKDSKFIPTDSNQVLSLLEKPNKSKGADPDGISSQLIIDCADLIAPSSYYFNYLYSSLANGIFPEDWISPQGLLLYSSKR